MKATRARKRAKAMQDHPSVYTALPVYSGGTRDTYVGDEWVWKVPRFSLYRSGDSQNVLEAELYAKRAKGEDVEIPVAECYLLNNGVLKMRRVKTINDLRKPADAPGALGEKPYWDNPDIPDWVSRVDSAQVGLDHNGVLVAYDV